MTIPLDEAPYFEGTNQVAKKLQRAILRSIYLSYPHPVDSETVLSMLKMRFLEYDQRGPELSRNLVALTKRGYINTMGPILCAQDKITGETPFDEGNIHLFVIALTEKGVDYLFELESEAILIKMRDEIAKAQQMANESIAEIKNGVDEAQAIAKEHGKKLKDFDKRMIELFSIFVAIFAFIVTAANIFASSKVESWIEVGYLSLLMIIIAGFLGIFLILIMRIVDE